MSTPITIDRHRNRIVLLGAAMMTLLAGTSQGTPLFTEQFDYTPNGPWYSGPYLSAQSAWNAAEPQPDSYGVVTGLTYPNKAVVGAAAGEAPSLPGGEQFTEINQQGIGGLSSAFNSAGTFYFSFLLRERMTFSVGDMDFNGNQQRTGMATIITGQLENSSPNYLAGFQINANGGETQDNNNSGVPAGNTDAHLFVFQVINDGSTGNDTVSMLFDPDVLTATVSDFAGSAWRITNQDITTSNPIDLFATKTSGGDETQKAIDEILFDTTLGGVLNAVPEPGTLALLVIGALSLCRLRRNR
jgi:hypothetical protein